MSRRFLTFIPSSGAVGIWLFVLLVSTSNLRSQNFETDPLSIQVEALVSNVLADNPELRAAEADVEIARGNRTQTGLWKNPDFSALYADRRVTTAGEVAKGYSDQFALTQTFEFPGKASLRKAIADHDLELAQAALNQFRSALRGKIVLLAYRYVYAGMDRETAELILERSRSLIEILDQRPSAGQQAVFDSGILKGNLADFISFRRDADQQFSLALSQINQLRGKKADEPLQISLPLWKPDRLEKLDVLLKRGFFQSPILKIKNLELDQARLNKSAAVMDAAPDFTIGAFYSLDNAGDHDEKIGMTAGFPLPLWNQNQGKIRSAKAGLDKAIDLKEASWRDFQSTVGQLYRSHEIVLRQIKDTEGTDLDQLGVLSDMADRQYRLGAINLQTFLEVQRQYLNTGKALRQAKLDCLTLESDLSLLLGREDIREGTLSAETGKVGL